MEEVRPLVTAVFDTNVVVDLLASRPPWAVEAALLFEHVREGRVRALVSASSITDVFYLCRKVTGLQGPRRAVEECLAAFRIIPVDEALLRAAIALPTRDVEDALQIACAIESRADLIVTRDEVGFAHSSVPAITPAELLAWLASHPGEHWPSPTNPAP